jgi:UDP-N-acetylmuramyl tripeptide synthase
MGEIAEQFADRIILTDDNPRNEAGDEIVQHIRSGMRDPRSALVIRDRAEAIDHAIKEAAEGDVILVAGKGHENYQESNGARSIFSDANHVRLGLKSRSNGMGS